MHTQGEIFTDAHWSHLSANNIKKPNVKSH